MERRSCSQAGGPQPCPVLPADARTLHYQDPALAWPWAVSRCSARRAGRREPTAHSPPRASAVSLIGRRAEGRKRTGQTPQGSQQA